MSKEYGQAMLRQLCPKQMAQLDAVRLNDTLPVLSGSQVRRFPLVIGERCPSIQRIAELDKNTSEFQD